VSEIGIPRQRGKNAGRDEGGGSSGDGNDEDVGRDGGEDETGTVLALSRPSRDGWDETAKAKKEKALSSSLPIERLLTKRRRLRDTQKKRRKGELPQPVY